MQVARALLDNRVVDRHGRPIGRVDSIIVSVSDGAPPRVIAIELSAIACARRIHPWLGRWIERRTRRSRWPIGSTRLPWRRVTRVGVDVHVDVDGERLQAFSLERWLRRHVMARLPWT
jgi:sporulation protein YlmC with PRC-barrel domain